MGILNSLKNSVQAVNQNIRKSQTEPYLMEGENILFEEFVKEDFVCLTDKRILFVNSKILSSKKGVTSVPLSKITGVSLEKGGMSFSKNVILWIGSKEVEIDTYDSQKALLLFNKINELILR